MRKKIFFTTFLFLCSLYWCTTSTLGASTIVKDEKQNLMLGADSYFIDGGIEYYLGSYYYFGPSHPLYGNQIFYVCWVSPLSGNWTYTTTGNYGEFYINTQNKICVEVNFIGNNGNTINYNGAVMF